MKHLGQDSIQQCLQTKDKVVYQHGFKDHVCHAVDHLFKAYKLVEAKLKEHE